MCRGAEVGLYLVSYRDSKEASVTTVEWAREKEGDDTDSVGQGWGEQIT